MDLDHIRRAAGYPIYGILGMDFLKRFVVQIDEDRGKLRFFDALPAAEGQRASIRYSGGTPQVRVLLDGAHEEILVLDTGYYSPASAAVTRPTFDKLVNMGRFDVEHSSLHVANAAGHANADRRIAVGTLSVGNTTIRDVQLIEAGADVLGLTFFARFKTTFDFPNDSLYLAPGRRFREPDLPDRSGLHIWRVDSSVAVRSVDERSPASVAEIKAGDIIVNVSGADAANMSLHQLRVLLRRGGDVVSITTARNGRRKSVHLALADSNGGMHKKDEQTGGKRRAQ